MTVTGKLPREFEDEPFSDFVDLFNYWADYPPVHLLVRAYLGYEGVQEKMDSFQTAEAMKILTGGRRAQKLDMAPAREQQIFADLKKELEKKSA